MAERRKRLPSGAEAGHHAAMPTASGRSKPGARGAGSGPRKRRRAPPAGWSRGLALVWNLLKAMTAVRHVLPALPLLGVVLAVFVLDPAAVAHLAWLATSGAFGPFVQVGVGSLLLAGAGLAVWAFWPEAADQAPPRRASGRTTERRASRSAAGAGGAPNRDPGRKRRSRSRTDSLPAAPSESTDGAAAPAVSAASATAAQPAPGIASSAHREQARPPAAPAPRRPARIRYANQALAGAEAQL